MCVLLLLAPPFNPSRAPMKPLHSLSLAPAPYRSFCAAIFRFGAAALAAALRLPRPVHVLDLRKEPGSTNVDLLVGAIQQAQCPDLVGGGHVVSGCFGFLAAVSGLESCDFGSLFGKNEL